MILAKFIVSLFFLTLCVAQVYSGIIAIRAGQDVSAAVYFTAAGGFMLAFGWLVFAGETP